MALSPDERKEYIKKLQKFPHLIEKAQVKIDKFQRTFGKENAIVEEWNLIKRELEQAQADNSSQ